MSIAQFAKQAAALGVPTNGAAGLRGLGAALASLEKLHRAARRAVDPWAQRPLIDIPAYANSMAVTVGQVIKANGNMYVVVVGGVTAASGTGPAVTFGAVSEGVAPNVATFTYFGSALPDYTDLEAPAVSTSTAAPSGLGNVYSPEPLTSAGAANPSYVPGVMRPIGSYVTFDGSNRNQLVTYDRRTNGAQDLYPSYTGWEFETDAPSVAIRFRTISLQRTVGIEIDGKLLRLGGVALPAGGQAFVRLDFAGAVRKVRRIRVWHGQGGDTRVADVYIGARDLIQVPSGERVRAAFISDSIIGGSAWGPMIPGGSFGQRIAAALGWDDPWHFTMGGTGYLNPGPSPTTYSTFGQRVPEALTRKPDAWVLFGSTNDGGFASADRQAAALATLRAIRAGSSAPIFMLGVWSVNGGAPSVEADMKAAFDAFADPDACFIPVSAPAENLPWITGSWNNAGHPQSANAGYAIAGDAIHPYDAGTALGAARAANEIRAALERL